MNAVKWLSLILLAAASLMLSACGSTERVRYKMVVQVETPEGLRTGSAVREVSYVHSSPLAIFTKDGVWVEGEAVAVDLPGGRTLFALLRSEAGGDDYAARLPEWLMDWRREGGVATGPVELYPNVPPDTRPKLSPEGKRPMLVMFTDPRDPMSVVRVNPADLAGQFGEGVRLKNVTVQISDDQVTKGIAARLRWLPGLHGSYLDGEFTNRGSPFGLYGGNFSSDECR